MLIFSFIVLLVFISSYKAAQTRYFSSLCGVGILFQTWDALNIYFEHEGPVTTVVHDVVGVICILYFLAQVFVIKRVD